MNPDVALQHLYYLQTYDWDKIIKEFDRPSKYFVELKYFKSFLKNET